MDKIGKRLKLKNPFRRVSEQNTDTESDVSSAPASVGETNSLGSSSAPISITTTTPRGTATDGTEPNLVIQDDNIFISGPRRSPSNSPVGNGRANFRMPVSPRPGAETSQKEPITAQKVKIESDLSVIMRKARYLNMPTSPPYTPDIALFIRKQLISMCEVTPIADLEADDWVHATLKSLSAKCDTLLQLLGTKKADVPESAERQLFVYMTIILSNTYQDMKHVYPNGLREKRFEVTKAQAFDWWKAEFPEKHSVSCMEFINALLKSYPIEPSEIQQLKSSIDITDNGRVSWFEFDVFTRLFQPWDRIITNWRLISNDHPGFQSYITYEEVLQLLAKYTSKPGSYVFRLSCTRLGQWAIGYVDSNGNIKQTIPQRTSLYQALIDGAAKGIYLYPMGQEQNVDLTAESSLTQKRHISVSKEQHDMYVGMDSLFELCKICTANPKDVQIEPCGHLICHSCVSEWQKQAKNECPFCRKEMRELQSVVVDPYRRNSLAQKENNGLSKKKSIALAINTSSLLPVAIEEEAPPPRPAKSPIANRSGRSSLQPIDASTLQAKKSLSYDNVMDFSGLGARQSEPPPKSPQPQVPSRLPDHVLNALQSESVSFSSKSHATVGRAGSMGIPPVTVGNVSPTTEHGHSSRRLPVHATQSMAIRTQPNIPRDFSIHVDHIRERSGSSAGVVMPASRTRTESPELSAAEALDAILKPSGSGGLPDNIPRLMHTGESVTTHAEATTNPSTPTPVTIPPRTGQAPIPSCTRTHSDETGPLVTPRRPIDTRRASTPGVLEIRSVMPSSPAELRSADDVVSSLPDRGRVGSHDSLAQNFDNGDPPQALPRSRSCSAGPGNGRLSVSPRTTYTQGGRLSPVQTSLYPRVRPASPLSSSLSQPNPVSASTASENQPKNLRQTISHSQVGARPVAMPRRPPGETPTVNTSLNANAATGY